MLIPTLIVIDDLPEAYNLANDLREYFEEFFTIDLKYSSTIITNGENLVGADSTIEYSEIKNYLSSAEVPTSLILVLDLGLNLPTLRDQLRQDYKIPSNIPMDQVEGIALALQVLNNKNLKNLLIYFSTGRGANCDAYQFLQKKVNERNKNYGYSSAISHYEPTGKPFITMTGDIEKNASKIFTDVNGKWQKYFGDINSSQKEQTALITKKIQKVLKDSQNSPIPSVPIEKITTIPDIYIGLGIDSNIFELFREKYKKKKSKEYKKSYVPRRTFLLILCDFGENELEKRKIQKKIKDLESVIIEEKVLIPIERKPRILIDLPPRSFKILKHWAEQAEAGEPLSFSEENYQKKRNYQQSSSADNDDTSSSRKEFQHQEGSHIEYDQSNLKALKSAISVLRKELKDGLKKHSIDLQYELIPDGVNGAYQPNFKTGIMMYGVKNKQKKARPSSLSR